MFNIMHCCNTMGRNRPLAPRAEALTTRLRGRSTRHGIHLVKISSGVAKSSCQ